MTFRKLSVLAWVLCGLAFVPIQAEKAAAAADALLVVVASSFAVNDISFASLKSSFRGQRVELGGKALVPINHPLESPGRVAFDRIALGLDPAAVGRFWVDLRIRDQGRPPTTASTPELALRIAGALPGAITYTTQATDVRRWPVKVLKIDGKSAGEAGYPLTP